MLPVVAMPPVGLAAAVRLGSAPAGWAPPPAGCAATLDATGDWALCDGSQAMKELAALPAIDWATCGVNEAQGSLPALGETTSSPVMRFTRLPVGSVMSQI